MVTEGKAGAQTQQREIIDLMIRDRIIEAEIENTMLTHVTPRRAKQRAIRARINELLSNPDQLVMFM